MDIETAHSRLRSSTQRSEESAALLRDSGLMALATALHRTAPVAAVDPAFRATLRAELLGSAPRLYYSSVETAVGHLWLAYEGETLRMIAAQDESTFLEKVRLVLGKTPTWKAALPEPVASRVRATIEGRHVYTGPVDLSPLTPFQRAVLEQAQRIPRGQVRPYAWIARELGRPRAVRAVGTALARNPLPFVIPCHRVVRTDGELGNYSGGGEGTKERILTFEGVDVPRLRELAQHGMRFQGSRNTKIFCLPTCYSLKSAHEQHAIYFHSADEAFAAGYRPCKLCRPAVPESA